MHAIELFIVIKNMLEVLSGTKTVPPCSTLFCCKAPGGTKKSYHYFFSEFSKYISK